MKKLSLALILSLLVLPSLPMTAAPQAADDVIEKHLAAMGGREALGKLTSRKSVGIVTISTEGGDMSGSVETYAKAPNKSRAVLSLDLSAMGMTEMMTIDQRFDGTSGWAINSMQGTSAMTGDQLHAMRNNMFPTSLLTYKEHGITITILPKETVAGKELLVLQLTPKEGPTSRAYLDPATYLQVRSVTRISSPETGELEQTSEISDYRAIDSVQVPFKVINTNPLHTLTIQLKSVAHNVEIDDAMFGVK
jgi:outer membrane lipoprotein-sorting protein